MLPRIIRLTLAAVVVALHVPASAQNSAECAAPQILDETRAALAEGRYDDARDLLDGDCPDSRVMALRLRMMQLDPGNLPSPIRISRRLALANRILEVDSTDAVALLEVARREVDEYLRWRKGTRRVDAGSDPFYQRDIFDIEALKARGYLFQDVSAKAEAPYYEAVRLFQASLESDPSLPDAARDLARLFTLEQDGSSLISLARAVRPSQPSSPLPFMMSGLGYYMQGELDRARLSFVAAATLDVQIQEVFSDVERILPLGEDAADDLDVSAFWRTRDPRLITTVNEREVEHQARLAYADLAYAWDNGKRRGWDSPPGRSFVRWGSPPTEYVLGGTHIWQYDDFRLVFSEDRRNGEYTLYSPPAEAFAGRYDYASRNDYVIREREQAREQPQRSTYTPGRRVSMPFLVSVLRGEAGHADVWVTFGVPLAARPNSGPVRFALNTGVFLTDESGGLIDAVRSSLAELPAARIFGLPQSTLYVDTASLSMPPGSYGLSVEFDVPRGNIAGWTRDQIDIDVIEDTLGISDLVLAFLVEESTEHRSAPEGFVRRGRFDISPSPWPVFTREQPLYLYFEAYGLRTDEQGQADYRVEALLVPEDRRGDLRRVWDGLRGRQPDGGVAVNVPTSGAGSTQGQYLVLDLSNQEPGNYVVAIRIGQAGIEVMTERRIIIE